MIVIIRVIGVSVSLLLNPLVVGMKRSGLIMR
jgi:hypothetical protein